MDTIILTIFKTPSLRWAGGAHENENETYLVRFQVQERPGSERHHEQKGKESSKVNREPPSRSQTIWPNKG